MDSRGVRVEIRKLRDGSGFKLYLQDIRDYRDFDGPEDGPVYPGRRTFDTFEEAHDASPAAVRWVLAQRVDGDRYGDCR